MLSESLISELQVIIKQEFGEDVDLKEAAEIGESLVSYFDLLAQMDEEQRANNANKETNEQPTTLR